MVVSAPPRVFISYSHDSREHEDRVLALSDRLRTEGVDTNIDQYDSAPTEGWPFWMERQIRESDFVLVVCTETYLRRVEHREEPHKGHGVLWEANAIYNHLYSDQLINKKFLPVLFLGTSSDHIPLPLRSFTRHYVDTQEGYEALYRQLTNQPRVSKPTLGHLNSLPAKEKSRYSLPSAFSLEQLSKAMSNPRYAEDIFRLDKVYDRHSVINKESVVVVVGTTLVAELLDRPVAELLRDQIDQRGGKYPFRRGIVITDQAWYAEAAIIANNPVIAVGGPTANKLSDEFDKWAPPPGSPKGKYLIPGPGNRTGFFRKNQADLPQVGLWGRDSNATRETVEHYFSNPEGLIKFLQLSWK
jgi:hypothetical protein